MIPAIDEAGALAASMSADANLRLGEKYAAVLTAEKVRCSPASPCSRDCGWL
jgi:hypothetical protein